MVKAKFTRFGPKHDYRGAQVALDWGSRKLLGDVREVYHDYARGVTLARVTHFNGEPWPVVPALAALEIMERW